MAPLSRERLADLLIDTREDLDLEVKNWLDLRNNNDAKATLAKAALALANHGGGFILLGLTEMVGGVVEAAGRPATLDAYAQDLINGIIQSYADPAFHCAVHIVPDATGRLFPVIVIPGGHRSPIRARRSGPHGNIVEQNAIYIRKPGPRSEPPHSGQEWDTLLARCLANRRDEMLDHMRDLLAGAVPAVAAPAAPARIEQWINSCVERWRNLVAALPEGDPSSCPHGYHFFAYELGGPLRQFSPAEFPEILKQSTVRHTGWPPFWYPTRAGIAPYAVDGLVECWLGRDREAGFGHRDAGHADFWRISPEGFAFLLRGYQEDGLERKPPGTLFDIVLPIWRVGETLLQAERLSQNLIEGAATVSFVANYTGLAGRSLTSITGDRMVWEDRIARQENIRLTTSIAAASINPNLPEIIQPLLAPLYALFDFADLPMELVTSELARMRAGQH